MTSLVTLLGCVSPRAQPLPHPSDAASEPGPGPGDAAPGATSSLDGAGAGDRVADPADLAALSDAREGTDLPPGLEATRPLDTAPPPVPPDAAPEAALPPPPDTAPPSPPDAAPAAVCGDGKRTPPEVCDDGPANGTKPGQCNPGCTGKVESKHLRLTPQFFTGNLGGVSGADAKCVAAFGAGWKALISDPGKRQATRTQADHLSGTGIEAIDPIDWVLSPFTRYLNSKDEEVWTTDESAMLGVRNQKFEAFLPHKLNPDTFKYSWAGCFYDWHPFFYTCQGWTSSSSAESGTVYSNDATTRIFGDDRTVGLSTCDDRLHVVCVEP